MNRLFSSFLLGIPPTRTYSPAMASHQRRRRAGLFRQEEAAMTLRMRLNVLAAIVSFAFLTAIVVGML
jgi:hypothetical protein